LRVRKLGVNYRDISKLARDVAEIINNEPTFTATLSSGTAATAVSCPLVGVNSCIAFMATTANAAAELATMYVSSRGNGTFTLAHSTAATGDRVYIYAVTG